MPSGETAENSSTRTRVGEQVLDDRGGEHRGQEGAAVGVQAEVDDVAGLNGVEEIDGLPAGCVGLQPPSDV